jgi:hypothetical protein
MADGLDKSRPASIVLQLADFDARVLTFTFPDSMTSCPQPRGLGHVARPYHEQVFTLPEITDIVSRHGFPNPRTPRNQRPEDGFIEVQVWDDRPLVEFDHRQTEPNLDRGPSAKCVRTCRRRDTAAFS